MSLPLFQVYHTAFQGRPAPRAISSACKALPIPNPSAWLTPSFPLDLSLNIISSGQPSLTPPLQTMSGPTVIYVLEIFFHSNSGGMVLSGANYSQGPRQGDKPNIQQQIYTPQNVIYTQIYIVECCSVF